MGCHHLHSHIDRRTLLKQTVTCAAHMALIASAMPLASRKLWAAETMGQVVAKEDFGSLVKIADGVWAVISTPLGGARTTVSNGGLIVGRSGVLAIEGFQTPEGAQWLAGKARELTGKWPTHVVLTHYHADHANGVAGYLSGADHPDIRATARTRDLVVERNQTPPDPARIAAVKGAVILSPNEPATLDLGGRSVRLIPRGGHTDSDVTLELDDPSIVFCGDLVWNAMFPNFVDTVPTTMIASIKALKRTKQTLYVPGHGALAQPADIDRYLAMHEEVEKAARKAHMAGISAEDAANSFALPASVGDWALFNPTSKVFYQRAFEAWYRTMKA
jgi:glyoxylase-like metal-dependent hydrolase (beta-lactamase superfamily II)